MQKITKEEQRSCKGVYFATFGAPKVRIKCHAEGIMAFLRNNILKVANYMSSLDVHLFILAIFSDFDFTCSKIKHCISTFLFLGANWVILY